MDSTSLEPESLSEWRAEVSAELSIPVARRLTQLRQKIVKRENFELSKLYLNFKGCIRSSLATNEYARPEAFESYELEIEEKRETIARLQSDITRVKREVESMLQRRRAQLQSLSIGCAEDLIQDAMQQGHAREEFARASGEFSLEQLRVLLSCPRAPSSSSSSSSPASARICGCEGLGGGALVECSDANCPVGQYHKSCVYFRKAGHVSWLCPVCAHFVE